VAEGNGIGRRNHRVAAARKQLKQQAVQELQQRRDAAANYPPSIGRPPVTEQNVMRQSPSAI
jgi:hypothetical protein